MKSSVILKEFDGHTFHPHKVISTFPIELGAKTISVKVEVVNASIEYNFLLGHPWFYEMKLAAYLVFSILHFTNQGKIMTIDQLDYCTPDLRNSASTNVSFVSDSP